MYLKCILYLLLLALPLSGYATNYYISSSGSDANNGLSLLTPWQSISRLNSIRFSAGDSILFKGGATFTGNLYFHQGNIDTSGTSSTPIIITSWGTGKAVIAADTSYGLYAHNIGGIEVRSLAFTGSGYAQNKDHGILFYNDLPGDVKLQHVYIDDVEVQGFMKAGISIGSNNGNSGFSDVRITRAIVHDIGSEGINSWGQFNQQKQGYSHQNIYVGNCHVYRVFGLPLPDNHSGSGIVISDVDTATIEHCVVHTSGMNNLHCGGPVGIWAWDANKVTIQFNEVYNMSAGRGCDGGGFDLDGGITNSVMQYNYSHDNDGPGYLVAQFEWARPMVNNVVRYNISENDGRKNNYKGITLWVADKNNNGGNQDLLVYNNTIYADRRFAPTGGGLRIMSANHRNISFHNNIFYTVNGAALIEATDTTNQLAFSNNFFYSHNSEPLIQWGDTVFTSLVAFKENYKLMPNEEEMVVLTADPGLKEPGNGKTLGYPLDLAKLTAYRLEPHSPLIDKGVNLQDTLPVSPATHDFFKNPLAQGEQPDIGAAEYTEPIIYQSLLYYTLKMDGTKRSNIKPGLRVNIVLKEDQRSGELTEGYVDKILTNSPAHPHGIKVRLETGEVGRVKEILEEE